MALPIRPYILCCLFALPLSPAIAQSTATLSAGEAPAEGRIAINIAAGNSNQEANSAVIAIGDIAATTATLDQQLFSQGVASTLAHASIGDNALAGASGMIAVNVAAGGSNQLGNLAVLAIGINAPVASEPLLEQTRALPQPPGLPGDSSPPEATAELSETAFTGATGLVQVNLVGGERNSSSNVFTLTVEGGE